MPSLFGCHTVPSPSTSSLFGCHTVPSLSTSSPCSLADEMASPCSCADGIMISSILNVKTHMIMILRQNVRVSTIFHHHVCFHNQDNAGGRSSNHFLITFYSGSRRRSGEAPGSPSGEIIAIKNLGCRRRCAELAGTRFHWPK